jgi:lantibiotic leader peptide-processing serine protease
VDGVTNPAALSQAPGVVGVEPAWEMTLNDQRLTDPIEGNVGALGTDASVAPWFASGVQWNMKAMHADEVWVPSNGGAGINVCVVDSGVDDQHQELSGGRVVLRTNFVTTAGQNTPNDLNGHGSHVASTVTSNHAVVAGVAPDAKIMGARVLNASGSGQVSWIVNGIVWCADNGAHVINMSLGGVRYLGINATATRNAYQAAINYARAAGVVVVTSSGNSNVQLPSPVQVFYPAQVSGTLIVGATAPVSKTWAVNSPTPTNPNAFVTRPIAGAAWNPFDPAQVWQGVDGRAFYSNFGSAVHVFAPGGRGSLPLTYVYRIALVPGSFNDIRTTQGISNDFIWAACASTTSQTGAAVNAGGLPAAASGNCLGKTDRYIAYAGTSMAAPHVSGLAALLYGELGTARSAASRDRVMNCIRQSTDNIGPASTFGGGRVNAKKAYDMLHAGTC